MKRALGFWVLSMVLLSSTVTAADPTPLPTFDPSTPNGEFTVISDEQQDVARDRWVVRIEVAEAPEGEQAFACAQAVFDYLSRIEAPVVMVFGFKPGDDPESSFTVCRATGSIDGKGWTGDGESVLGLPDDTTIQVEMGDALDMKEHTLYSFDLREMSERGEST